MICPRCNGPLIMIFAAENVAGIMDLKETQRLWCQGCGEVGAVSIKQAPLSEFGDGCPDPYVG